MDTGYWAEQSQGLWSRSLQRTILLGRGHGGFTEEASGVSGSRMAGGRQAGHATFLLSLLLKRRPVGPQLHGLPVALDAGPVRWALAP